MCHLFSTGIVVSSFVFVAKRHLDISVRSRAPAGGRLYSSRVCQAHAAAALLLSYDKKVSENVVVTCIEDCSLQSFNVTELPNSVLIMV